MALTAPPKPSAAELVLFDFDCTLTTCDTIWPFVSFLLSRNPYSKATQRTARFLLAMLEFRLIPNHIFKMFLVRLLLQGQSERKVLTIAESFHDSYLHSILNRDVFECLARFTAEGKDVYLVSSNFDFVLEPLQQRWNLKGIVATRTERVNGSFSGRILGRTCHGKEKVVRVIAEFGESRAKDAAAFGDSPSDAFLLNFVKSARWVRPQRFRFSIAN